MSHYSIKDLERLSGIRAHTLRIWEKRYNLLEPKRTSTNIRYYGNEDLKRILNVALINRNGTKISRIAALAENEIYSIIKNLTKTKSDTSRIDNLVIAMVELDESNFNKILSVNISKYGFEETILHTIYPFLEKIGILWQTGAVNPAQEHFISNLIRQKLSVAIEKLQTPVKQNIKSFLIFLPEGEMHELGLMFYHYLIKKNGYKALYLGQSLPFEDIGTVIRIIPCDYIITSFSSFIQGIDINRYISKLSSDFPERKILFSAFDFADLKRVFPRNVTRLRNAEHFMEILKSLSTH